MAFGYFVQRPSIYVALRWDGDNLEELQNFVGGYQTTVNEDGSVAVDSYLGWPVVYQVGDYVGPGGFPFDSSPFQQVDGPNVNYVVE